MEGDLSERESGHTSDDRQLLNEWFALVRKRNGGLITTRMIDGVIDRGAKRIKYRLSTRLGGGGEGRDNGGTRMTTLILLGTQYLKLSRKLPFVCKWR